MSVNLTWRDYLKSFNNVSLSSLESQYPDIVEMIKKSKHPRVTKAGVVSYLWSRYKEAEHQRKLAARPIDVRIREMESRVKNNIYFTPSDDMYKAIDTMNEEEKESYLNALKEADEKDTEVIHQYNKLWEVTSLKEMHGYTIDFLTDDGPIDTITDDFLEHVANQFEEVCNNTPDVARVLFKCTDIDGKEFYFRKNNDNMEFIKQLIKTRGSYNETVKHMTGSDIDWFGEEMQIASIEIIDIDQLPDDLKKYHIKGYGGYFPYILNCTNHSLARYQIYNLDEVKNEIPDENCFIYALRMAGVHDVTLANIKHDIGNIPFVSKAGVRHIAEKYGLHILIVTGYDNGRKYDDANTEYGKQSNFNNLIRLGLFNEHYFVLDKDIDFNVLYFKYRDCPECAGVDDDKMWYTNGYNRSGPRFKTSIKVKDSLQLFRNLFKFEQYTLIPITPKTAPKTKAAEDVFEVDETNFRPYISESDNPISRFYSSIPNLYQVGGNLEMLIRKCIYGGRVLIAKEKLHVKEELVDLDFNALYPTAETKLFVQTGNHVLPIYANLTVKDVLNFAFADGQVTKTTTKFISYAIMKIEITAIGKERKYPVINDLKPGIYSVDLFMLQDLVKYHEITARIIGGLIWDGDRDYSIQGFVRKLYSQRKDNPEIKTIMNKMTGYTMKKGYVTKIKSVNTKKQQREYALSHPYTFIRSRYNKQTKQYDMTILKKWTDTYNMAYLGTAILSMSKRIMNEVLYTCEDNGIDIYYSDTDSIFIRRSDLNKLNDLMGGNLIGNDLGQVKIDFDSGEYATEAIFLSKKRYICKLSNGEYHFRYAGKNKADIKDPWNYFLAQLK